MSGQCNGKVSDGWRSYRCSSNGRLDHDGKWWCKLHHPPTVAAKRAAREAKWKAEREADDADRKLKQAIAKRKDAIVRAAEEFIATPAYWPAFKALRDAVEMEGKETR